MERISSVGKAEFSSTATARVMESSSSMRRKQYPKVWLVWLSQLDLPTPLSARGRQGGRGGIYAGPTCASRRFRRGDKSEARKTGKPAMKNSIG